MAQQFKNKKSSSLHVWWFSMEMSKSASCHVHHYVILREVQI